VVDDHRKGAARDRGTGPRLIQKLSPIGLAQKALERVKGIEPSSSAWKAVGKPNKINGD
jgi:hypothetical protein